MSAKYTFWAWKQAVGSHTAKLVLLKLADAANDEGESWYSISKMLIATELSDRAFRCQLRKLEELGLLVTQARENRPNLYTLVADYEGVNLEKVSDDDALDLFAVPPAPDAVPPAPDAVPPAPDAVPPAPDADDLNSIPNSDLITDSTSPEKSDDSAVSSLGMKQPKEPRVPLQEIIELYHAKLPEWPRIRVKPSGLDGQLRARWKSKEFDLGSLDRWERMFDHVRKSDFLMGRTDNNNPKHANWRPDLLWLTKPSTINKLIEGNYHAR